MARKCNFDREEKLHQAMTLFWQKGYANTAISDLVDHLQINRFSLYNAFGDKQKLYYEALDRYLNLVSSPALKDLELESAAWPGVKAFCNILPRSNARETVVVLCKMLWLSMQTRTMKS